MASKKRFSSPDDLYDGGENYDNPDTGSDPGNWDEKWVADCPQRGRQPKLDLSPEGDDFYNKGKYDWEDPIGAQYCMEDYKDLPAIDLNEPTPLRKKPYPVHGWGVVAADVTPTSGSSGGAAKGTPQSGSKGSNEQR